MKHLFVVDPLEAFLPDADTTIAFMREAASRGHQVHAVELQGLSLRKNGTPYAHSVRVEVNDSEQWYAQGASQLGPLDAFDVVWMRKDPPFDMDFFYATHMLSATADSTLVVNDPEALRNANEKLFALRFPELCPPTLVTSSIRELREFRDELGGEMIIKPLDGAGGEGIFHLHPDDRNVSVILDLATHSGQRPIMAQRYIPEIREGDKRIIMVEGEPKGAVLRVPQEKESRANFHAGGSAARTELSERDREICARIGPTLRQMGIVFAGIDVIGDWLTEINVTSPTGIREIRRLGGPPIEVDMLDAVERRAEGIAESTAAS